MEKLIQSLELLLAMTFDEKHFHNQLHRILEIHNGYH